MMETPGCIELVDELTVEFHVKWGVQPPGVTQEDEDTLIEEVRQRTNLKLWD